MAKTDEYKDGVTLMAEAIRREREEAKKKAEETKNTNVSQATAQFSNKSTAQAPPKAEPKAEPEPKAELKAEPEPKNDGEPDGTI